MNNTHSPLMPLPFGFHIGFICVSAVLLILYYIVAKKRHTLVLLIAVLSTALIYFVKQGITFYILCIEEWCLAALFIIASIRDKIDEKKEAGKTAGKKK